MADVVFEPEPVYAEIIEPPVVYIDVEAQQSPVPVSSMANRAWKALRNAVRVSARN